MLSLVSAVTLPVCFVEAGCAAPLIGLVYGTRWLPSGQPLTWLALLAALQIFFQLTFDYFVVLAKSRVIFTLQLVWLAVLIPGLIAGARVHGIAGVALAEVAVAAVVPLPWYLLELRRDGSKGRVLAGRLGLPLAGALKGRPRRRGSHRAGAQCPYGDFLWCPSRPSRDRIAPASHAGSPWRTAESLRAGRGTRRGG